MALNMARPYKHPKTGIYWLRKVVPEPLRPIVGQRELKASLRTKDPEAAKVASRDAQDRFDALIAGARAKALGQEAALSIRELTAAVGVAYREEEARWADDPGNHEHWDHQSDYYADMFEQDDEHSPIRTFSPDRHILEDAKAILARQGIMGDRQTVRAAAEIWARERLHLAQAMMRRCAGDWASPTGGERFPPVASTPALMPERVPVSLASLVAAWAAETGKVGKALYDRERTANAFAVFMGAKDAADLDAARVTADDVVRWKESRIKAGRSLKTVANDLNEMSPIWKWAKRNRKLAFSENPFAGLAPMKRPGAQRARRPYIAEEARRVLEAARGETGLLRWLPWVLAFTGARLGEVVQSVKEDFAEVPGAPGTWALHIHGEGEGRSLKTPQSRRHVPLHPALVAEGFMAYVESLWD